MTAVSQSTRRKLSLLQLAAELDNVSKACRIMGYRLKGRTPAQALCEALGLEELPRFPQADIESDPDFRKEGEAA